MTTRLAGAVGLAALLLGCTPPAETPAPTSEVVESVFFLVRHAEKADQSEDPPLTEEGHARARVLAHLLRDAGIEAIFSSDFERTRDTAAPLASDLGLAVTLYDPTRLPELARTLLSSPGRALVVGHSNTTPELAGLLGGEPGAPIPETEYDRLYVLHHNPGVGTTTTTLLRLGDRP
jgi:broad specificity phosphatase PhoE